MGSAETKVLTDTIYEKIVAFSPYTIFEIPKCNAAKGLIKEMIYLIRLYTNETHLKSHALKTLAILPYLICQRTHEKSRAVDDRKALERRIELWKKGEIQKLLTEAEAIQKKMNKKLRKAKEIDKVKKFASLMGKGKVAKATRELTTEGTAGTLPLDVDTCRKLKELHPTGQNVTHGTTFDGPYVAPPPAMFSMITGERIRKHALHTHGAAGPSGLDAKGWKNILSVSKFGAAAKDLGDAVATLARKMATEDCQFLEAITACRLIALNKNPGCRPVGVGEVLRRIIGKAVMEVTKDDVRESVGNLQVCVGQQAGCEAAVHAIREIYQTPECEAVLMVDASNAFNTINRRATIQNIKVKCPILAKYVENTYKEPAHLYISDSKTNRREVIKSEEGTTQGDPIAMAMYALGLSKLQGEIRHAVTEVKQVAYADDLTGAGKIDNLRKWWDKIMALGPPIGYFPNERKSVLIVKPGFLEVARVKFGDMNVKITEEGDKHLGAVIGTTDFKEKFVKTQVAKWKAEIERLAEMARSEPHAAYSAFTFGVKHRWNFLMRTVPNIGPLFAPLEATIREKLLPELTGRHILAREDPERAIIALPPRLGGLGIPNPWKIADTEHQNSMKLTAQLTQRIVDQDESTEIDLAEQWNITREISKAREAEQKTESEQIKTNLENNSDRIRRLDMAQEVGASNWLTALPIRAKGFSLNKQEFVDALALRYGWPIDGLPQLCTCGTAFDPNHAMNCKTGGFICIRHDEIRDLTAQMLNEVCHDVRVEPLLIPTNGRNFTHRTANTAEDARVDVSARGFWARGQRAYLDVRIYNPMAQSHRNQDLLSAHKKNENEKKREYDERIREVEHGTFTPLVFTSSGGMAPLAIKFYSTLAQQLAEKRQQPSSCITAWLRCRLSFSLLRSAILCLRGTRTKPPAYTSVGDLDFQETVIDSRIDFRM